MKGLRPNPLWVLLLTSAIPSLRCAKPVDLKGVKVALTQVEATVTTTTSGTVEAEQQAILSFSGAGRVSAVHVKPGSIVKEGQILAELEHKELATILSDAQRDLNRAEKLYQEKLVSRVTLDEARRNLEVAKANSDKAVIRAPFDGMITEVNLEVGESPQNLAVTGSVSEPPKAPLRIADLRPRVIKGNIDELDLGKTKPGAPARIKIQAIRPTPFQGQVKKVVPFISANKEQDRTAQIELAILDATETIPVGASADIEVIVASKAEATALPTRVILGRGKSKHVFKWVDGHLQKVDVTLGIGNYDRTEIASGVQLGDVVVYPSETLELTEGLKAKVDIQPWP